MRKRVSSNLTGVDFLLFSGFLQLLCMNMKAHEVIYRLVKESLETDQSSLRKIGSHVGDPTLTPPIFLVEGSLLWRLSKPKYGYFRIFAVFQAHRVML